MDKIKCIIIDDEKEAVDRLANLLSKNHQIELCAKETHPDIAVTLISKFNPDLIFIDVEMPGKTGFDVINDIRDSGFYPSFIFVTAYNQYAIKAIRKAAFDYLLKPVDIDELNESLERFIKQRDNNDPVDIIQTVAELYSLTDREQEIIKLLAQNKTSREIADILYLSKHTIDTHRRNILKKTNKESTSMLIASLKGQLK